MSSDKGPPGNKDRPPSKKGKGRPCYSATLEEREQLREDFLKAVRKKNGLLDGESISAKQLQTILIANRCPSVKCTMHTMYKVFGMEREARRPPTDEMMKAMKRALRPDGVLRSTLSKVGAEEARALRKNLKKDIESVLKDHHIARASTSSASNSSDPGTSASTASLGIGTINHFFRPGPKKPDFSHAFVTHMSTIIFDVLSEDDLEEAKMRIKDEFLRLLDSPVLSKMMRIKAHELDPDIIREEVIKMIKLYS